MAGEKVGRGLYATKRCPRCGAELYSDMHICYGCLYDFTRDKTRSLPGMPELPEFPEEGRAEEPFVEVDPIVEVSLAGDTEDLADVSRAVSRDERVGMLIRTLALDVWTPVPEEGLSVGRDASNEVVVHSPAVSRHHLRVRPTPDGMEVTDLGSTNPATYQGRNIARSVVVSYGDSIDVCGTTLIMTGTKSIEYRSDV